MRNSTRAPAATVPSGLRLYAVGDIHGRADLLDGMSRLVAADLDTRPIGAATTVFLGDYVDRGPASSTVLERLATGDFPTPIVALRGNHDAIFASVLRGEIEHDAYRRLGGDATLASYGLDVEAYGLASPRQRSAMLAAAVPARHRRFLDDLELSVESGDYFFCHAGVRPGVALDRQTAHDLMWIRDEFLESTADFGRTIVHGHTPARQPRIRRNGIGIDTQAFASGVLTALVLEGAERRFLQTG